MKQTIITIHEYTASMFITKELDGEAGGWQEELTETIAAAMNGEMNMQDLFLQGIIGTSDAGRRAFERALIDAYDSARDLLDDGKTHKRIKNAFDRAMKLGNKNLTIRLNKPGGHYIIAPPIPREVNKARTWKYSKAAEKVAKEMATKTLSDTELAKFFTAAGFDADMLREWADMMEAGVE